MKSTTSPVRVSTTSTTRARAGRCPSLPGCGWDSSCQPGEHVMNAPTGTGKYERLLARCGSLEPVRTAVAHPCEETALAGALGAAEHGLIAPILIGPTARIREIAAR